MMGKSSKLSFGVKGRKQKQQQQQQPQPPIVSPPMSKAQRLLGTAHLNIDGPKQWDESSNSGYSANASDSNTTYRGTEAGGARTRHNQNVGRWEMESETVPAHIRSNRIPKIVGENGTIQDEFSDASDLRRQHSNSTLRSWYDKTKMPLHISQQTSASAMAKGPPLKALALLDVDENGNPTNQAPAKQKKRPGRLDLSHLMPGHRHKDKESKEQNAGPSPNTQHAQGVEFVMSPSSSSAMASSSAVSTDMSLPSPGGRRASRRLVKKPTKERLAELAELQAAQQQEQYQQYLQKQQDRQNAQKQRQGSQPSDHTHASELQSPKSPRSPLDLYEHYEKASFRQFLGQDDEGEAEEEQDMRIDPHQAHSFRHREHEEVIMEEEEGPEEEEEEEDEEDEDGTMMTIPDFPAIPGGPTPLRSPSNPRRNNQTKTNPIIREPQDQTSKEQGPRSVNGSDLGHQRFPAAGQDHDYASSVTSVSSRHTKTSKYTEHSVPDSDRQERSVLSLSSDSEEDDASFVETASKSAVSISSLGWSTKESPAASARRPPSSRRDSNATSEKRSIKRASFAPTNTYLTIPSNSPPTLKPTTYNPRSSSLFKVGSSTAPCPSSASQASSRVSMISMSSTASTNAENHAGRPANHGVQEVKAVSVHPVASTAESLASEPHDASSGYPLARKQSVRSEQPTPPLSPSSVDFCLQPDPSTADESASPVNPRFMAVTRQEQMLLAALRNKRAMMRENILAEYEDGSAEAEDASHSSHKRNGSNSSRSRKGKHKHTSSQATIRGLSPQASTNSKTLKHQASGASNTTLKAEALNDPEHRLLSTSPAGKRSSSVPSQATAYKETGRRSSRNSTSSSRSLVNMNGLKKSGSTSSRGSRKNTRFSGDQLHESVIQEEDGWGEEVLVYLDRPRRNVTSMDQAEPSPDLDGFMSFDDLTEDDMRKRPGHQHQHQRTRSKSSKMSDGQGSTHKHRKNPSGSSSHRARSKGSAAQPSTTKFPERAADHQTEVPRSDSPVSSRGMPSHLTDMTRKKAVRLSAVGRAGPEMDCWGDDG